MSPRISLAKSPEISDFRSAIKSCKDRTTQKLSPSLTESPPSHLTHISLTDHKELGAQSDPRAKYSTMPQPGGGLITMKPLVPNCTELAVTG